MPPTVTITDEQLLAITQDSQDFADLKMPDKIRWFQVQNAVLRSSVTKLMESMPDADGLRITDKGCLSLSLPNSWPVSLYRNQWEVVVKAIPAIQRRLANDAKIINKPPKAAK